MTLPESSQGRHLVIGLGDTGARILTGVRQRLFLQGGLRAAALDAVDWLALDEAGGAPARASLSAWTVVGHDLQLPRGNRLALEVGESGIAGGLDRRRLVHQALSAEAAGLRSALRAWLASRVRDGLPRTVHLLGHLGGSFGSGALPELLELLQAPRREAGWRLQVHLALPSTPTAETAGDAVEARAAAALQELLGAAGSPAGLPFDLGFVSEADDATERLADWVALLIERPDLCAAVDGQSGLLGVGLQRQRVDVPGRLQHLAHETAQRMLYQLRHDHWRAHLGFVDHAGSPADDEAPDAHQLARWQLDDAALLMLPGAAPVTQGLPEAGSAPEAAVAAQWQEYEVHFRRLVAESAPGPQQARWISLFETAWEGGWHGIGVERHYTQLSDDLFRLADARAQQVESDLLQDWQAGRRSLHGCGQRVAALMADLATRGEWAAAQAEAQRIIAVEHDRLLAELEAQHPAGAPDGRGRLAGLMGLRLGGPRPAARQADTDRLAELLRERAVAQTLAAARQFAAQYARALSSRLSDLIGLIDAVELTLGALAGEFEAESLAHLPERTSDHPLDPRLRCDELRQRLLADEAPQRALADEVRRLLFDILGKRANFRTFALELAEDHLRHPLLAHCAKAVQRRLDEEPAVDAWEVFEQRWQSDPAGLAHAMRHWATQAREGAPDGVGAHWLLVAPAVRDDGGPDGPAPATLPAFSDDLVQALAEPAVAPAKPAAPALRILPAAAAETGYDAPMAALVCLSPQAVLADRPWVRRLHAAQERVRLKLGAAADTLYTQASAAPPPALVPPDPAEALLQARSLLLLAATLQLLQPSPDPASGEPRLLLVRKDGDGFDLERTPIGRDLADALQGLPQGMLLGRLRQAVFETDLERGVHEPSRHDVLRDAMRQHLDAVRAAAAPADVDAVSLAWSEAARAVMRFARKEAPL